MITETNIIYVDGQTNVTSRLPQSQFVLPTLRKEHTMNT
jgi:hypothetical protein